jgi:hypothetical protein
VIYINEKFKKPNNGFDTQPLNIINAEVKDNKAASRAARKRYFKKSLMYSQVVLKYLISLIHYEKRNAEKGINEVGNERDYLVPSKITTSILPSLNINLKFMVE